MANYIKSTAIQENSISETKLDSSLQSWKETVTNHINNNDNPHNITKSSIGLDNVTNDAQVKRSELGVANGVATLDSTGKVPSGQLPSYVDDVIEGYLYNGVFYKDTSYTTSIVGESGKIYIDLPTNKTYRWTGSVYGVISETIALGETSSTAYRGDRGKIAYDHSQSAHAPSNAQANVIETIKVNGTALTPNSKAVDITIPTIGNGTITIKQGGTSKGTFTTNQNGNTTIELTDTNTTYTAGDGLSLSGTTFSNNGVRSIATGTTNGTISVNTNGNISNIEVYGLKSAAYTNSSDYAAASHTHSYLPLSGGTMTNTNVVTNLNADLLDGYHVNTNSSTPWGTIPAINERGWMEVGKHFEFHYDNTTGSDYSTALGCTGNYGNFVNLPSASGTLALTTDNVASASKWATPRTITLTGSVTGSVSIDGSQNVTLATTTNHTHNYLPLSGGTLSGSDRTLLRLKSSNSLGPTIDFHNPSGDVVVSFGHIPSNTNYGTFLSNVEGQIGLLLSNDGVAYLTTNTNYLTKNYTILHSGNYNSYAPKLDGTGASGTWGISISGDAATLGGLPSSRYLMLNTAYLTDNTNADNLTGVSFYINTTGNGSGNSNFPTTYGKLFSWGGTYAYTQLYADVLNNGLYFRTKATAFSGEAWKAIAFTDSNVASATNADTIDGYHADSFTKKLDLVTTDLDSIGDSLLGQQSTSVRATPELHYPVQEAGGLISILSAYSSTNQIYGTHLSNRWFARGAGTGLSSRTSWREFAFLDSNVASATNADKLDGFHASDFSRHITGTTQTTGTKYFKLGNLPESSDSTWDAFLIQGEIGNWGSILKTVLNVCVSRRDSVTFCGYTQGLWNRNLGIDIGVNDAGEIVLIVTEQYCAWTLDLHTIQGTISYTGKTFTPTDTNFVLLSASNNVSKSLADGTVEKATKLATSRTIWGQSFDGTGNVSGALTGVTDITASGNAIIDGYVGIGMQPDNYHSLAVEGDICAIGIIRLKPQNQTYTYNIDPTDGSLYITPSGRSTNPAFLMSDQGYVYLNCNVPGFPAYPLVVNGTISCTKLLQTSDIKYKTNIKQIEYEEALKIIENLNPVTWDWNENTVETGSSSGFVAQEAEEFIPNAISRDNENNLSLDYTQLHSYEIKVIQEQQKEIKDLKQRLEVLENLVLQLTNREI